MSVGGSTGGSSSQQSSKPWAPQVPYLMKLFSEADRLYGGAPAGGAATGGATAAMGGAGAGGGGQITYDPAKFYGMGGNKQQVSPQEYLDRLNPYDASYNTMMQDYLRQTAGAAGAGAGAAGAGAGESSFPGFGGIVGDYYPGSTVANQSSLTGAANIGTAAAAGSSGQIFNPIMGDLAKTLSGQYMQQGAAGGEFLNANPYLDKMYKNATDSVIDEYLQRVVPETQSKFARAGRYGSGALESEEAFVDERLRDTLGKMSADIYGQDYARERGFMESAQQAERDRMLGYGQMAPALEDARYIGARELADRGAYQDAYLQSLRDADVARWNFQQDKPFTALQRYMSLIQPNAIMESQGTQKSKKGFGFSLGVPGLSSGG